MFQSRDAAIISGASDLPFVIGADGQISVNAMRPFFDTESGDALIVVNNEGETAPTTNATLQFQEWLEIDRTVIETVGIRLNGIADLRGRNLVHRLGGIGQTISMWQTVSDMDQANVSMDGVTRGQEAGINFGTAQVPVPIVHKDWRINMRRLQSSRMMGESVDVTAARMAARTVAEASERMLFSGSAIVVDGNPIYGYRNFPGRAQVDLETPWDEATPVQIKADVQAMLAEARKRKFYSGFTLYIPAHYEGILDDFYVIGDTSSGVTVPGRTIRDVLLALSGLERIVVADGMGEVDEVLLVALDGEVVDLAIAQEPTTISWQAMGGMQELFKTMAVWVPRIKSDFNGNTGIVHLHEI